MKWIVLTLCCLTAIDCASAAGNILLIIADDYGIDGNSLYNTSSSAVLPPTPKINELAANGIRFTNAYAYPLCSPTRSSILTGRYGFRTGTGDVVSMAANNSLKTTEFTLPDAFAANPSLGYQLKHFGKWHLTAGPNNKAPSTIGGWPAFAGSLGGEVSSYTNWTKVITDGTNPGTSSSTSTTYATTDLVNDAVPWIQAQTAASKPWFAWVAFNAPHFPFHLPTPTSLCPHYTGLSGTTNDINNNRLSYYNAMVEAMDTEIGRLLNVVNYNTTTVIFIGDNGTNLQVLQSPFPSGRGKDTLYEGGLRVPMIIRGASVVAPGRISAVMTHVVDLYATILEIAGINVATTIPRDVILDSKSLLPILQNQTPIRSRLYSESFDASAPTSGGRVLRDDQYKLIRNATGTDEFYDLLNDPYESTNLVTAGVNAMTLERQIYYHRLRYDLGRYTSSTTPTASNVLIQNGSFRITVPKNATTPQTLYRCTDLQNDFWVPVAGATSSVSGSDITFTDPSPPATRAFYSVLTDTP